MLFNSLEFAIFLPLVFVFYWIVVNQNLTLQNSFLLVASYFFYGYWDVRFLSLLVFITLSNFIISISIDKNSCRENKLLLLRLSLLINIGVLIYFKYFNFFIDSFVNSFAFLGYKFNLHTLNIILPLGISFYTFQSLSYTVDVYRGRLKATKDLIAFAAFVSFFPQLVAGPIERASNLLSQMHKKRQFDYNKAVDGTRLMLWGFFKKVVIADNLSPSVNEIFSNYHSFTSDVLVIGAFFFAIQIYCDFSGYSDIARGVAKLLGFELMVNFDYPYFSRNIGEFWRKWHISLTTWFRDYLYIPLGGSKNGKLISIRNILIIFLVSGFWHGANWTFIAWGAIHALLFVAIYLIGKNRKYIDRIECNRFFLPKSHDFFNICLTFAFVTIGWIFFRSDSIQSAIGYIVNILQFTTSSQQFLNPYDNKPLFQIYIILSIFITIEYCLATKKYEFLFNNKFFGVLIDAIMFVVIVLKMPVSDNLSFIYFQF